MTTDFNNVISQAASQRGKEAKAETLVQLVVFELDKEEYAVPIEDLREIIRIPEIAPVPNAPEFIRGILNLRGTIVVVMDLEKRFHLTREGQTPPEHIIITEVNNSTFGIMVDRVSEVLRVPVSKIQSTPALVSSRIHAEYLKGVVVLEEAQKAAEDMVAKSRLIILLDLPKMLQDEALLNMEKTVTASVQESKK